MLKRPLQFFERLRPMSDLIPGRRLVDVLVQAVALQVRLYEVSSGRRSYDLRPAAFKELRDAPSVVIVAMCAYNVVLPQTKQIEWCIAVCLYGIVLDVFAKANISILYASRSALVRE